MTFEVLFPQHSHCVIKVRMNYYRSVTRNGTIDLLKFSRNDLLGNLNSRKLELEYLNIVMIYFRANVRMLDLS